MATDKVHPNQDPPRYHCCFCRHFQLSGYRWGYCDLLDVYVRGDRNACQVAVAPFTKNIDSIADQSPQTELKSSKKN